MKWKNTYTPQKIQILLPLLRHQYHYAIYLSPAIMSNPISLGQSWKISTDKFSVYGSECDYRKRRQSALYCKWEVIVTSGSLINSCLEQCLQLHHKWDVIPSYYLLRSVILLSSTMIGCVSHLSLINISFIFASKSKTIFSYILVTLLPHWWDSCLFVSLMGL